MNPHWNSFSEFLSMGEHGFYVWGAFIVMIFFMVLEPALLVNGRRKLIARLGRQFRASTNQKGNH